MALRERRSSLWSLSSLLFLGLFQRQALLFFCLQETLPFLLLSLKQSGPLFLGGFALMAGVAGGTHTPANRSCVSSKRCDPPRSSRRTGRRSTSVSMASREIPGVFKAFSRAHKRNLKRDDQVILNEMPRFRRQVSRAPFVEVGKYLLLAPL